MLGAGSPSAAVSVRNSFTVLSSSNMLGGGDGSIKGAASVTQPTTMGFPASLSNSESGPVRAASLVEKKEKKKKTGWAKLKAMF
jgi:hypothetical protein